MNLNMASEKTAKNKDGEELHLYLNLMTNIITIFQQMLESFKADSAWL